MMEAIQARLVLADDCVLVREMLAVLLRQEGCEIVEQTGCGQRALSVCRGANADLLILNLPLRETNGPEVLRLLRGEGCPIRTLIYAAPNDPLLPHALRHCPNGFVSKAHSWEVFRDALRVVTRGGCYLTGDLPCALWNQSGKQMEQTLSPREAEIIRLVAEGFSSKEVARKLNISVCTAENHRTHVMEKLKLRGLSGL